MAETKIEWADFTFNPVMGCTKVSPACKNCYAERDFDHRRKKVKFGPNGTRVLTSDANWAKPLKWNRDTQIADECFECGEQISMATGCKHCDLKPIRPRVFCASLADVFEDWDGPIHNHKGERLYRAWHHAQPDWVASDKPCEGDPVTMDDVRKRLFELIDSTPHLDWLLLTKRPENIRRMWPTWPDGFPEDGSGGHGSGTRYLKNVWLGTSVENQEYADKRIPELLKCRDLAPVLFLSCEPLLSSINLGDFLNGSKTVFSGRKDDPRIGCNGISVGLSEGVCLATPPHSKPRVGDMARGEDRSEKMRHRDEERLPDSTGELRVDTLRSGRASRDLDGSEPIHDSTGDGDKSCRRLQEQQRSEQLRVGDEIAERGSRVARSWSAETAEEKRQSSYPRASAADPRDGRDNASLGDSETLQDNNGHGEEDCKSRHVGLASIDWVIVGGESGPDARPSHPDWFCSLRDQCSNAGVPFLFKQWGEWIGGVNFSRDDGNYNETPIGVFPESKHSTHYWEERGGHEEAVSVRVGKKAAGRLLDGVEHNGFPRGET